MSLEDFGTFEHQLKHSRSKGRFLCPWLLLHSMQTPCASCSLTANEQNLYRSGSHGRSCICLYEFGKCIASDGNGTLEILGIVRTKQNTVLI